MSRQYHILTFLVGGRAICRCGGWQFRIGRAWWSPEDRDVARRIHAVHKKKVKQK